MLESPPHAAGQLPACDKMHEPPRTIERKRKGRMVDVVSFLPTPPRTKDTRLDPSPLQQTVKPAAAGRRRPGLTFAQQMGQHGPGVGMGGGMRTALIPAAPILPTTTTTADENPFLVFPPPVLPLSPTATPVAVKKQQAAAASASILPSPPPTVRQRPKTTRPRPSLPIDEASNPFYAPSSNASTSASALALQMAQRQEARRKMEESETITYVHRGSKRVFANPFHPSNLPHDDGSGADSPHPNPQPKLLFPNPPSRPRHPHDDDDELHAVPRRLFGLKRVNEEPLETSGKRRRQGF